ncbi:hypothetical protein ACT7DI_25350 [Bacillus paranthracis]
MKSIVSLMRENAREKITNDFFEHEQTLSEKFSDQVEVLVKANEEKDQKIKELEAKIKELEAQVKKPAKTRAKKDEAGKVE